MMQHNISISLDGKWSLAHCPVGTGNVQSSVGLHQYDYDVPGDIHSVFIREKIIADPLCDANNQYCRWLEDEEFWCRRTFILTESDCRKHMELTFDGLDCTADIWLNGNFLGKTNNALVEMSFDVSAIIRKGANELIVRLDQGLEAVKDKPLLQMDQMWNNAQPYRAWMRKPQFVYGWDWTIWLPTCGIWKSVHLTGWDQATIRDVHFHVLNEHLKENDVADIQIDFEISGFVESRCYLELNVNTCDGIPVAAGRIHPGASEKFSFKTFISQAHLWWSNGLGVPYLYQVEVLLKRADGLLMQRLEKSLGLRTIAIQEERLSEKESGFTFLLNDVPVFCKGANVTPEDCLPGRITDAHTRETIRLAKEANMNMLRVWGGGVYASDAFLDACDQAGIMVWHDFMFACGYHPDHDQEYMHNVEQEAEKAIRRLRSHPCLIGWAGNNEIQEMHFGHKCSNPSFPFYGEKIYTRLLPDKVRHLHPGAIYRESSPLGGPAPADIEMGDQHIWHFTHRPGDPLYLDLWRFTDFRAKFLSEFGLIGAMNLESAEQCISQEHLHPDDPIWLHHTNDSANHQLLNTFVHKYFGEYDKLTVQQYILRSQAIQAEITRHIYDEFRARKFECSGLLFWTLGDSLGMHNWALLDYYLHKRPVYHYLKRSMAPVVTAIRGYDVQTFEGMQNYRAYWADTPAPLTIWGINDTLEAVIAELQWQIITRDGHVLANGAKPCTIAANTSECLDEINVAGLIRQPEDTILHVSLIQKGEVVHENRYFFAPFKMMLCPHSTPQVLTERIDHDCWRVTMVCDTFVWMLHLETPEGVDVSDNDFDLLPGVPRSVMVHTQNADYIARIHWLGEPDNT